MRAAMNERLEFEIFDAFRIMTLLTVADGWRPLYEFRIAILGMCPPRSMARFTPYVGKLWRGIMIDEPPFAVARCMALETLLQLPLRQIGCHDLNTVPGLRLFGILREALIFFFVTFAA